MGGRLERRLLARVYAAADRLVSRLPGRSVGEKRLLFNLLVLALAVLFYVSPAPSLLLSYAGTVPGVLLAVLLLLVAPAAIAVYALGVLAEYAELARARARKSGEREDGR